MRNSTKANRSSVWCLGLCLLVTTAALGVILILPAVAADTEVNIDNFAFTPNELAVKAGTTVVFRNRDDIPHSVVDSKGEFHSKALDTDDSFSFTFAKAGTYAYSCGLHPRMQGRIVVKP
ncbi:MAG: cupredoxin family copper-binding protein [Methylocella sp.]